jgi:hypothetical protein
MEFMTDTAAYSDAVFGLFWLLGYQFSPRHGDSPSEGYRLAANYCEHYDPPYGNGLNGPSVNRIEEIAGFVPCD